MIQATTNGKMKTRAYIDQILNPIVESWIDTVQDFVVEEDSDSGHGTGKLDIVQKWKKEHGLERYLSCAGSRDPSPIRNCWQARKQTPKEYPHWDNMTSSFWSTKDGRMYHRLSSMSEYPQCLRGYVILQTAT